MPDRRRSGRWLAIVLFLCGFWCQPAVISAGQESTMRDQDIILQIDSRWPGNTYGGYFPLRIKISNMGAPRILTLVYDDALGRRDHIVPTVQRTVKVEQQATINFTLSIPMVSRGTEGRVRVFADNGEELEGLTSRHALPNAGGDQIRTSLLVISTEDLDDKQLQPFEDAASTESAHLLNMRVTGGVFTGRSGGYGHGSTMPDRDHVVVQPAQNLPTNWIDYSGVDLVAVDWQDWNGRLSAAERDAILKWTATGGVLTIYRTGQPAAQSADLNQSLQLGPAPGGWVNCVPKPHYGINIVTAEVLKTGRSTLPGGHAPVATAPVTATVPDSENPNRWDINEQTFSHRDWGMGKVYIFPKNPFPGTATDWAWWLSTLPQNLSQWPRKMGMSARYGSPQFLMFLIPGVGSVPVFAFLLLITLFTIIIGPLNYYWLHQRRRLAAMVLTVPLIASVACILLFSYSLFADGFSIRSRVHSFTWLDQQRKSAVSMARLSLYAPFAPSAGLKFSPECAVFPIWPQSQDFEGGTLDWSANDQRFASSWFRSQTWTQFQTIENRDERGRLDYTPPADPNAASLKVANGLSWDLKYLAVKASNEKWYAGGPVPAGATAELKLVERDDVATRFNLESQQTAWKFPDGMTNVADYGYSYRHRYPYGAETVAETDFAQGILARYSAEAVALGQTPRRMYYDWREQANGSAPQPLAVADKPQYWAITEKNPGIQTGVKSSIETQSLHLLFGTF